MQAGNRAKGALGLQMIACPHQQVQRSAVPSSKLRPHAAPMYPVTRSRNIATLLHWSPVFTMSALRAQVEKYAEAALQRPSFN